MSAPVDLAWGEKIHSHSEVSDKHSAGWVHGSVAVAGERSSLMDRVHVFSFKKHCSPG